MSKTVEVKGKKFSEETIYEALKAYIGDEFKETRKLTPYFGEVKYGEVPIAEWKGHFGLTEEGGLAFCTPGGTRISKGSLAKLTLNGLSLRTSVSPEFGVPLGDGEQIKLISCEGIWR